MIYLTAQRQSLLAFLLVIVIGAGASALSNSTNQASDAHFQTATSRAATAGSSPLPADLLAVASQPMAAASAFDAETARLANAALPFAPVAVEAALPFALNSSPPAMDQALNCLTQAVYYEAGYESVDGKRAVAQVILNRMRHPAYPNSICGVVYQGSTRPGCQFSFTCDGSLARKPSRGAWIAAAAIARDALSGTVFGPVGQATHYHADYVAPYWAPKLAKIIKVGAHIFYRWPGNWGLRRAFTSQYAGEPASVPSRMPAADAGSTPEVALASAEQHAGPSVPAAPNDVGGKLDVSKGWKLSIPDPSEMKIAFVGMTSKQQTAALPSLADASTQLSKGQ